MRVDWKETIDVVYLRHTLAPFGIYIHQVNDGTEDICLVFSTEPLHAVPLERAPGGPPLPVDGEGAYEPGLPPLAPAFANAIARLTGKPLRQLPFNLA
jgi:hypothetical protein